MTKRQIKKNGIIRLIMSLIIIFGFYAAQANAAADQKTTLALGGNYCDSYPKEITKALMAVKGVKSVDLNSMEGHAIVTHDGSVSPDSLVEVVKGVKGDKWYCTAEIMKMKSGN